MRKHTGKTPLSLGLLLNVFIKQILTLFDQQTLATAKSKTVHIAYAFQHTAGQQINLFSTQ
jgi:hypothetical protein